MGDRTSLRYRYEYRLGIWANDMADDSIDTVISHIDMGYLVTLPGPMSRALMVNRAITTIDVSKNRMYLDSMVGIRVTLGIRYRPWA